MSRVVRASAILASLGADRPILVVAVALCTFALAVFAVPPSLVGALPLLLARLSVLALAAIAAPLLIRRGSGAAHVLGLSGLVLVHTALSLTGGAGTSPLYPLALAWIAATAALLPLSAIALTAAAAVGVEVTQLVLSPAMTGATLVAHVAFMAVFAALFAVLLRGELGALRKTHRVALDDELVRLEQDARDFRLAGTDVPSHGVGAPSQLGPASTIRRKLGSVRAIREGLQDVLELARTCVDADSVMLFFSDETNEHLTLKACAPADRNPPSSIDSPISATSGAVGAVVRTRGAVRLIPKHAGSGLGHRAQKDARSFLGVPLIEGDAMRGVLAAHRTRPDPFAEADELKLAAISQEVLRVVESERIFAVMDQARHEHERFYDAFALLNEALTVDGVAERLLEAVFRIRPSSFGAVTLYDVGAERHTILRVRTERPAMKKKLEGLTYGNKEGGLVAMALKNGHPLPYVPLSRQPDPVGQQIFGSTAPVPLRAVKVFPMMDRNGPLGALVVGSTQEGDELTSEDARSVETFAAHAAIALANARMYKEMETMATTDGLTGLANRRRFSELLGEALARAERFDRKVSVLIVDADHFKRVNDTYGHPVGDLVLIRIAKLLQEEARRTDVVARWGGEEFIVILDETETAGALQVAERMRESIANERIQGDFGRIQVTASMGLATWPVHAKASSRLVDLADAALYQAKEGGRNQVVVAKGAGRCIPPSGPDMNVGGQADAGRPRVPN